MAVETDTGYLIKATREIVLCAGAIDTPRLLLLSGVGPVRSQCIFFKLHLTWNMKGLASERIRYPLCG